jgi:hypothetical protein
MLHSALWYLLLTTIEIANGGKPLYDKYRSICLFGMDKRLNGLTYTERLWSQRA